MYIYYDNTLHATWLLSLPSEQQVPSEDQISPNAAAMHDVRMRYPEFRTECLLPELCFVALVVAPADVLEDATLVVVDGDGVVDDEVSAPVVVSLIEVEEEDGPSAGVAAVSTAEEEEAIAVDGATDNVGKVGPSFAVLDGPPGSFTQPQVISPGPAPFGE